MHASRPVRQAPADAGQAAQPRVPGGEDSCYVPHTRNFCHGRDIIRETRFFLTEPPEFSRAPRISRPRRQEILPLDFLTAYHQAMGDHRRRWRARARSARRRHDWKAAKYAADRARAIALDPFERKDQCGVRKMWVKCGCRYVAVPIGCGQRWLCPTCAQSYYKRQFRRLKKATRGHERAAYQAWLARGRPKRGQKRWVLLTLTVRHSGDLAADRARVVAGWKRLRQWLWARMGKFPFALAWEVTPGEDGKGHLHAHVAALWPWTDYSAVAAEWKRATDGWSTRINIAGARKGPGGAAHYLAKYASKGVELDGFNDVLAAHAIGANYGKRLCTTSHRFWVRIDPACKSCHERFAVAKLPTSLAAVAPFTVWDANARLHGVECGGSTRGSPTTDG